MNLLTLLKKLEEFLYKLFWRHRERPKISLLIPFKSKDPVRKATFKWLREYWKHELPDAEIIVGHTRSKVFCKAEALNDAARKANGKVLVIIDADAYLEGSVIEHCADRIIEEQEEGERLWYVPYRHLYRLNRRITRKILESDPRNPLRLPVPPPPEYLDDDGHKQSYGHRYGAMIMMFPREALDVLGCFDERFRGWGGEDVALLRALDTLYAKHKTTPNAIFHLWHPFIGDSYRTRVWQGQKEARVNERLANKYNRANRNPSMMRELADEACRHKRERHKDGGE